MKKLSKIFFCFGLLVVLGGLTGCKTLSAKKHYGFADLRISYYEDGSRSFSFVIDEDFNEMDESEVLEEHPLLTKNQYLLLFEHLKRNDYCRSEEGINFKITGIQDVISQEVSSKDDDVYKMVLVPKTFFGKCLTAKEVIDIKENKKKQK
jgi:hypothetical protein